MHNPPATRIKFDRSALRQCVGQHNNCRQLVVRALQYPSPAVIASIAGRVFNRDLKYQRSSSGDANGTIINGDDGLFVRIPFEGCTVHIAKMVCAPFDAHAAALERAGRHCEPGDIVILESLDLSKGHCFP